ncbi:MAG: hypothetical protein IKC54_04025 [Clostridia bacterium]|nr:hypothetical protein [Clostridia bacterium]
MNNYGKQESKLDPKYYPWIWVALVFATIFGNIYNIYTSYVGENVKGATLVINLIIDLLLNGLLPVAICYFVSAWVHRSNYVKKRLGVIPRNDFIYITMIFIAIARMFMGLIRVFAFLDSTVQLATLVWLDMLVYFVVLYVEFFVVLIPKYLNPIQAQAYFRNLSRNYVIAFGIISVVFLLGIFFVTEGLQMALDQGTQTPEMGGGISFEIDGEELTQSDIRTMLLLFKGPLAILSYVNLGVYALILATHFIMSAWLKKKANAYRPTHSTDSGAYGGQSYSFRDANPFADTDNSNPFDNNSNPFADNANPFDDNPFDANPLDNNSKDDNPFDEF